MFLISFLWVEDVLYCCNYCPRLSGNKWDVEELMKKMRSDLCSSTCFALFKSAWNFGLYTFNLCFPLKKNWFHLLSQHWTLSLNGSIQSHQGVVLIVHFAFYDMSFLFVIYQHKWGWCSRELHMQKIAWASAGSCGRVGGLLCRPLWTVQMGWFQPIMTCDDNKSYNQ